MDKDPEMLMKQELISYTNTAQEQRQHMEWECVNECVSREIKRKEDHSSAKIQKGLKKIIRRWWFLIGFWTADLAISHHKTFMHRDSEVILRFDLDRFSLIP